ncbi:hypothetical protein PF005_g7901 [Phytophthora fragariae]|uniref:Uncharacterized protein n=2 Tax=Phytophthora TaxID=4783 RepID=A0A6A3FG15_9STRA|nr:hypothetical protein PF003_g15122 [Phytophthora fragariae]KAE9041265.1 hypothetical protein PR002_g4549 [Phytophthora rubi]KAE8945024.1 hypothetical protein PF009_g5316 [Phytophthora fragariae]KAE9015830.1 hypothetical protein PF011_g7447 [Phytophthora fragariae]KAE9044593.1 hypothetical protein PR001_g5311 [Phytophthora rubi]
MSDFTDDEDRQLVNFALAFLRNGPHILWDQLTQQMKGTKKPKEALRQRLKTLKRTHGRNLEAFPAWFFKAELTTEITPHQPRASRRPGTCAKAATRERDKAVLRSTRTRCKPHGRASIPTATQSNSTGAPTKTTTKLKKSAKPNMPPRFQTCSATLKMESCSSSLLLLASVASTSGHAGKEITDSRYARV